MKKLFLCFALVSLPLDSPFFLGCNQSLYNEESPPSRKVKVEYDYRGSDRWDPVSTEETFSTLKIEHTAPQQLFDLDFQWFQGLTDCEKWDILENNMQRDHPSYPIYLQQAQRLYEDGEVSRYMGFSNNWRQRDCQILTQNWSFLFYGNIEHYFPSPPFNRQSLLNRVAAHELLHQVANTFGYDAHYNHDINPPERCALWVYIDEGYEFTQNETITKFDICPRHTTMLRQGPDIQTERPFAWQFSGKHGNDVYSIRGTLAKIDSQSPRINALRISLAKTRYKQFEPILIKFTYVNETEQTDTIRQNFVDGMEETDFKVRTAAGKIYSRRNPTPISSRGVYFNGPTCYLQPGDTLLASMILNKRYGEETTTALPFDLWGLLVPGTYEVSAKTVIGSSEYETNVEKFEVIDLDEEDRQALQLVVDGNIDRLLIDFPQHPFIEHALLRYVARLHMFYDDANPPDLDQTISDYRIFFDRFPNSYYCINMRVMKGFLGRLAYSTPNFMRQVSFVRDQFPGTLLYKTLATRGFIDLFFESIKRSKGLLKSKRGNKNK